MGIYGLQKPKLFFAIVFIITRAVLELLAPPLITDTACGTPKFLWPRRMSSAPIDRAGPDYDLY